MMDRLKAIEVFVAVAHTGGFASAAESLGLSTSSVSRHVGNLEDALGVQLLHRTTRHLRLTPEGEDVLEHAQRIAGHVERMMREQRDGRTRPSGRLRITAPSFFGVILMHSVFADYASQFPDVEVEYVMIDRVVNIVEEGFDLAIRVGSMPDSSMIARKLVDLRLGVIASPDYLARCGTPRTPADLTDHNCIIDTAAPYRNRWPMIDGDNRMVRAVSGNVSVNNGAAARDLALGGAGLAYLPEYIFFAEIEAGRLVTVLDEHAIDYGGTFLVYPPGRHRSAALRHFVEMLVEHAKAARQYRESRSISAST